MGLWDRVDWWCIYSGAQLFGTSTYGRQRKEVDGQRESWMWHRRLGVHTAHQICPALGQNGSAFIPPASVWRWCVTLGEAIPEKADSSGLLADSSPSSWNSKSCLSGRPGHLVSCPSPGGGSGLQPWLWAACSFCGHHHPIEFSVIPLVFFIPPVQSLRLSHWATCATLQESYIKILFFQEALRSDPQRESCHPRRVSLGSLTCRVVESVLLVLL